MHGLQLYDYKLIYDNIALAYLHLSFINSMLLQTFLVGTEFYYKLKSLYPTRLCLGNKTLEDITRVRSSKSLDNIFLFSNLYRQLVRRLLNMFREDKGFEWVSLRAHRILAMRSFEFTYRFLYQLRVLYYRKTRPYIYLSGWGNSNLYKRILACMERNRPMFYLLYWDYKFQRDKI